MDTLGDYLKKIEDSESGRRVAKGKPLVARLDGRSFHTFTHGLARPYDLRLSALMMQTTKHLVSKTNALVGYTQSDEITLVWYLPEGSESQYLFDGRYQKLASNLAAIASVYFNKELAALIPEKADQSPIFDCRVNEYPTLHDAYLVLLWRERDAIKNSISMAAQAHFSVKELHKKNSSEKLEMLREIAPWDKEPEFFKKGIFFKRAQVMRELTAEELQKIPEKHRGTGVVERAVVVPLNIPDLDKWDRHPTPTLFRQYAQKQADDTYI